MAEEWRADRGAERSDWVARPRTYFLAWGLPSLALVAGLFLPAPLRALVWTLALTWKGIACLVNARRCGRVHCRVTGPFFLIMALLVALEGSGLVSFGPNGWLWLAAAIVVGTIGLWWGSERIWGRYQNPT